MVNAKIITFASWEDRFRLGLEKCVNGSKPKSVTILYLKEYSTWTEDNRSYVLNLLKKHNIDHFVQELTYEDPVNSWKDIFKLIVMSKKFCNENVIVDISTMPREFIWIILSLLEETEANIDYLYYKPLEYNAEWLSRDPSKPRIVFKLGGEAKLGGSTTLLILTGMDPDRTEQLVSYYEPKRCLIGLQMGNEYQNQEFNVVKHRKRFDNPKLYDLFDVDSYSSDHGLGIIKSKIEPLLEKNTNIIMSSLGPKLSAIALYRLHKTYLQTALAYAPSKEFNREYSRGIKELIRGHL